MYAKLMHNTWIKQTYMFTVNLNFIFFYVCSMPKALLAKKGICSHNLQRIFLLLYAWVWYLDHHLCLISVPLVQVLQCRMPLMRGKGCGVLILPMTGKSTMNWGLALVLYILYLLPIMQYCLSILEHTSPAQCLVALLCFIK